MEQLNGIRNRENADFSKYEIFFELSDANENLNLNEVAKDASANPKPGFQSVYSQDCKGGHEKRVTSIEWSPGGEYLASSSEDKTACIWSFEEGGDPTVIHSLRGHKDFIERVRWNPSNENVIATGSLDKTVCLWDSKSGTQISSIDVSDPCVNLQWSPDGTSIVTLLELEGNNGGSIINIIDTRMMDSNRQTPRRIRYPEMIQDIVFSACGKNLFLASSRGFPTNVNGYGVVEVVGYCPTPEPKQSALRKLHTLEGNPAPISSLAISPSGDMLISGGEDSLVQLWGLKNLECVGALEVFDGPLLSLSVSFDGQYVAAAAEEESLSVVDLVDSEVVYKEEKMLTPATPEADATFEKTIASCVDWHPSKLLLAVSLETLRSSISSSTPCIKVVSFGDPINYSDGEEEWEDEYDDQLSE